MKTVGGVTKSNLLKRAGIKHGFSQRGPANGTIFGSLNVKSDDDTPDDPKRTRENRKKIYATVGLNSEQSVFLRKLAHGNTVFQAHKSDAGHEIDGYDAIITDEPIAIALSVADCVPILIYSPDKNAVGVIHAGWRSTQANAVNETVKEMIRHYGVDPAQAMAILGPSICGECYETGEDVAELFDERHQQRQKGRLTLDLRAANVSQLKVAGVVKIEDLDVCTYENTDRYFSARKEGQTGRFLAFIAPKS